MRNSILIKTISVVLVLLLVLAGCSAKNIETATNTSSAIQKNTVISNLNTTGMSTNEETESANVEAEKEELDGIYYGTMYMDKIAFETYGVGETLEDLVVYKDEAGSEIKSGYEGLFYTLNNVEVYDDFNSSGRDAKGKLLNSVPMFDWNNFIVLELTAEYKAPEGGPDELVVDSPFTGSYVDQRMAEDFFERIDAHNHFPYYSWFSGADETWYSDEDVLRGYKIKDGESLTFEIGLSVGDEFLENENVYLETHWVDNKIKGVVHKYFDIFGCETTDWSMTKAEYEFEKGDASTIDKDILNETVFVNIANIPEPAVIKGKGDTLPMYLRYKHENEENYRCIGTEGVYLTLDNITYYDNFYETGLTLDDLSKLEQEYLNNGSDAANLSKQSFSTCKFVILDLTAEYNAPEGAPETVEVMANASCHVMVDKHTEERDTIDGFLNCYPGVYYYSCGYNEEGYSSFTISNGEAYSYKVGIKVGDYYVKNNNVYFCTDGHNPQIEDFVYYIFDISPEE